jgi:TRAP-type C4-dicarboxylate transport system permease small subunit
MKIYLSISLILSVLFIALFGTNVYVLFATVHETKNLALDIMLHGVLFVLFAFQAYRAFYHLRNIVKRTRNENLQ